MKKTCQKCALLMELYEQTPKTPRDYWVMTELFVMLHGSDVCERRREMTEKTVRRMVEILIDGKVTETIGCSVTYDADSELSWMSRITFDELVLVQDSESMSYRFVDKEISDE